MKNREPEGVGFTRLRPNRRASSRQIAGESKRQIAKQEGLRWDTVDRILCQPEVENLQAEYRQRILKLVPVFIEGLAGKLLTTSGKLRAKTDWKMLVEILKGAQVLVSKQDQEVKHRTGEFDGWTRRQLEDFILSYGQIRPGGPGQA